MIFNLALFISKHRAKFICLKFSEDCRIGEHGGFLKYKCPLHGNWAEKYKCHSGDEYYYIDQGGKISGWLCSDDPHFYQACDRRVGGYTITEGERLCKNWLCQDAHIPSRIISLSSLKSRKCDQNQDCVNNLDETSCSTKTTLRSGKEVETNFICNRGLRRRSLLQWLHLRDVLRVSLLEFQYQPDQIRPSQQDM